MRTRFRWGMMRLAVGLSRLIPCNMTSRFREASISNCMRNMW